VHSGVCVVFRLSPLQPIVPEEVMDNREFDVEEHITKKLKVVYHIPLTLAQVPAPPQTPPTIAAPLPKPIALRITCTHQLAGYYCALNEGQHASSATTTTPDNVDHSSIDWVLAAAEAEPTLHKVLSGPNGPEWKAAVDYEINQLEKLKAWKIVTPPHNANIIPCHFILVTKCRPDSEKLKLRA
jgi:hypothetical protein